MKEVKWDNDEVMALVGTALSSYIHDLHFNDKFANEVAKAIAVLDENYKDNSRMWRFKFSEANKPFVDYVVGTIAKAKSGGLIK